MGLPINKGIRDYSRISKATLVTYTQTQTTATATTSCPTTYSNLYETQGTSYYPCQTTQTTSTPSFTSTTLVGTTTRQPSTNCLTCPPTFKTYPTSRTEATYTITQPKWRDIENPDGKLIEQVQPFHPLGVCGLAKWFMADRGHPTFGIKKKIHKFSDEVAEYLGEFEENGILEAGGNSKFYNGYFSQGTLPVSTLGNKDFIKMGDEGYIRGAFLWRYNYENPNAPIFRAIEDLWTEEVDNAIYPTTWVRVRVQGVKLNEDGEIVEIALVTKYGTGTNPVYAISENDHDGTFWSNGSNVLTRSVKELGFEGHTAIVSLDKLWEFHDKQIFYFHNDPTTTAIDNLVIAGGLPNEVGNTLTYPLTLTENLLTDALKQSQAYATIEKKAGINEVIEELDVPTIIPKEDLIDKEAQMTEALARLKEIMDKNRTLPVIEKLDPKADDPANTPTDSQEYLFNKFYPNIWRMSTSTATYTSSNYPYKKTWLIDGANVSPTFRITEYRQNPKYQDLGLVGSQFIHRALDPKDNNLRTWTWSKEWVWTFDVFGTTDWKMILGHPTENFLHDYMEATIQSQKEWNTETTSWDNLTIGAWETQNYSLKFKWINHPILGYELIIENEDVVFPRSIDLKSNFMDNAIIPLNMGGEEDRIYLFEFQPYTR